MTTWHEVIERWEASLERMESALDAADWVAAADAVWTPPSVPPTDSPEPTQRLQLADLDRRSGRMARSITEVMAMIGEDLVDSGRRRGAARAYHARMG